MLVFSLGSEHLLLSAASSLGTEVNHYLAGNPPFEFKQYVEWIKQAGLLSEEWLAVNEMGVYE